MIGHPDLFSGFNSAPNNGDEVDGAGINYPPVSPNWFLSLEPIEILIITEEMMSVFVNDCPDLVIGRQPDTVVFPREFETLMIRGKAA